MRFAQVKEEGVARGTRSKTHSQTDPEPQPTLQTVKLLRHVNVMNL